ncbi:hypothetical protein E2C01_069917 [Portunus trituberculatus]|uniref:Uncharacterized protein n=1 Tax=Portunus trituberculatus TaxID=210409 RepID=A0A5B7I262_PORTR|nr:hypothetical protein [Portunus trituberculatus]
MVREQSVSEYREPPPRWKAIASETEACHQWPIKNRFWAGLHRCSLSCLTWQGDETSRCQVLVVVVVVVVVVPQLCQAGCEVLLPRGAR